MKPRLLVLVAIVAAASRAQPSATPLGSKLVTLAGDATGIAAEAKSFDPTGEATEIARLERLPSVAIPVQDETLAGAITTIATASGMNFIAPAFEEFPEKITLTTKVSPWRLLNRLSERYRFTMAYRDGIWEFNREAVGAILARVYSLKHTNLDVYKASQNSFSAVGAVSNGPTGANSANEGGMVFSAQTQKLIDDVRELIGLVAARVGVDEQGVANDKRPVQGKAAESATESGKTAAKVIYIPDVNALYVACTRAQHELVAGYLRLVDQSPRQVQIEARFFETTWDPKTILGINPENFQPRVSLAKIQANLDLVKLRTDTERALLSVDDVALQMNALRSDSQSRLVQSPTVITANNREVYFSVGDEEPFVSSNNIYSGVANAGLGTTTANVAIRRIGTSVNVVPTVFEGEGSANRRVRLVVRIEVGALKGFRQINSINVPVVSSQKYEYTTYVGDNQALAFGGLAGIGETNDVKKVPVAGDVPVVGYLFKSKSHEVHQRNLVAYIIARVIDTPEATTMPPVSRSPSETKSSHIAYKEEIP